MEKIKSKKTYITLLIIAAIALVGFVVGSMYDFDIANTIHKDYPFTDSTRVNTPFFSLVLCSGIIFTAGFSSIAITLLMQQQHKNAIVRWLLRAAATIAFCVINYSTFDSSLETVRIYASGADNKTVCIILILIAQVLIDALGVILTLLFTKEADEFDKIWVGLVIIAMAALYLICGEIVKLIASRPRPRVIYNVPASEEFKSWWEVRPFYMLSLDVKENCKSFVSGHVANCSTYMFMTPLFLSLTKLGTKKWTYVISVGVAGVYAFVVAISRIYAQAHFLSDVSGAILLIVMLIFFMFWIVPIIRNWLHPLIEKWTK